MIEVSWSRGRTATVYRTAQPALSTSVCGTLMLPRQFVVMAQDTPRSCHVALVVFGFIMCCRNR